MKIFMYKINIRIEKNYIVGLYFVYFLYIQKETRVSLEVRRMDSPVSEVNFYAENQIFLFHTII